MIGMLLMTLFLLMQSVGVMVIADGALIGSFARSNTISNVVMQQAAEMRSTLQPMLVELLLAMALM